MSKMLAEPVKFRRLEMGNVTREVLMETGFATMVKARRRVDSNGVRNIMV